MRNWKKFTWFILLVNLLFLVLAIAVGVSTSTPEECQGLTGESLELCKDVIGYVFGGYALLISVFILWAVADLVLGIVWLVTKKRKKNKAEPSPLS